MKRLFLFCLLVLLVSGFSQEEETTLLQVPTWAGDKGPTESRDGFFALKWDVPEEMARGDYEFEIQESPDANFSNTIPIYSGPNLGTSLSGYPEGRYFYRVRSLAPDGSKSEWSKIMEVQVDHHSLAKAFSFLGVGILVFLLTAGLIIGGTRKQSTAQI